MTAEPKKALSGVRLLLLGTLTVGTLDILDAIVFFGLRGVSAIRIFQSIASGLLGRESFQGGFATAALGGFLHYFIAFAVVATYYWVSLRWPSLARYPFRYGPLYGLAVYAVMNLVVLPLSLAHSGLPSLPVLCNGLLIHMFGIGLPSALFARAGHNATAKSRRRS